LIGLITLLIVSPGFRWFFLNVMLNILLNSGGSRSSGAPRTTHCGHCASSARNG